MFSNTSYFCSKSQTVILLIATVSCTCTVSTENPGSDPERSESNDHNVSHPDTLTIERHPPSTSDTEQLSDSPEPNTDIHEKLTQMANLPRKLFFKEVKKQALDSGEPTKDIRRFMKAVEFLESCNDANEDDEKSVRVAETESVKSSTFDSCGTDASIPNLFNQENRKIGMIQVKAADSDYEQIYHFLVRKEFASNRFGLFLGPNVFAILKISCKQPREMIHFIPTISFIECDSVNALWRNLERVEEFIRCFDMEHNRTDGDIIDTVNHQELRYLSKKNPKTRRLGKEIRDAFLEKNNRLNEEMQSIKQAVETFQGHVGFGVKKPEQPGNMRPYNDDSSGDDPELRHCCVELIECVFSCFKWCFHPLRKYETCDDCCYYCC